MLAYCCRLGQEYVVEIVTRSTDLFNTLKSFQVVGGVAQTNAAVQEKKAKVGESLKHLSQIFKRLRAIHERVNSGCADLGGSDEELLNAIPLKGRREKPLVDKNNSEVVKQASEEHKELVDVSVAFLVHVIGTERMSNAV
jgi:hypothetical protein